MPANKNPCGSALRNKPGRFCGQWAGARTDHPGVGRCWLHGGASPIKHGRYSSIPRERLREKLEQLANDPNPLDLVPDLQLLRAVLLEVNSLPVDKMGPKYAVLHADLIERMSRVAKRIHEMQNEQSLSVATFRRLLAQMGLSVAKYVDDATWRKIEAEWNEIKVEP